jgi:hypothetical protein
MIIHFHQIHGYTLLEEIYTYNATVSILFYQN